MTRPVETIQYYWERRDHPWYRRQLRYLIKLVKLEEERRGERPIVFLPRRGGE